MFKISEELRLDAVWTNDCNGKMDYDGEIIGISTRYWPGYTNFSGKRVLPSARSSILLRTKGRISCVELLSKEFEGETKADVHRQVEVWAEKQYKRIIGLLKAEFDINI